MTQFGGAVVLSANAQLFFTAEAENIMVMPAIARHYWTASDVRELMDDTRHWPRYELLDGELLVTNAPTLAHQFAVGGILVSVRQYCEREGVGFALTSPADIELAPESIMQPDVFVIPNNAITTDEPLEWPHVKSLLLAVEVLSPSTMRQDRTLKRDFYLANGVHEYWIVDLDARVIERWAADRDRPDIHRDELVWRPFGARAPFLLNVAAFFAANKGLRRRI